MMVTTPPLALVAFPRLGCQTNPPRPTVLAPALEVMQKEWKTRAQSPHIITPAVRTRQCITTSEVPRQGN